MIEEFITDVCDLLDIEIPKIYSKVCRTGCMGCPYGSYKHDTEKELAVLNKNQYNFVCNLFKESYEALGIGTDKLREEKKGDD